MLTILWRHEPDFQRRVLGRRSFHRSVLKDDTTEDDGGGALYQDVAGERLAERAGRPRSEWLEAALSPLADEAPESAARKMSELVFLANVLMSAVQLQGRAFRETKAVKVAMATANLGLSYLPQIPAETAASTDRARQLLKEDPGVVRLFQNGYRPLSAIPRQCCEAVYRAKAIQAKRPGHVVILEME